MVFSLTKDDDYESRKAAIARQEKLAEMLSQMGAQEQAVSTAGGITAPMSGMGALARGLTSFGGSYLSGKAAADAAALKKAEKADAISQLSALYHLPDTTGLAQSTEPAGTTSTPYSFDVPTLPGQKPSGQTVTANLNMPNLPGVTTATIPGAARPYEDQQRMLDKLDLSDNPYIAKMATGARGRIEAERERNQPKIVAAGANGMININPNSSTYGKTFAVPAGDEYSTNLVYDKNGQAYQVSKTGGPPRPVTGITARDQWSMGMTPNQIAQYNLDVAKYGIEYANAQLGQNRGAFEGVDTPGMGGITPPSALRGPGASPVAPATAPITQPTIPAQPRGNAPGAMPRTAAPSQIVRPPTKPTAASAEVPLTDPRNPVYRGMAPKNVQENITKLNLERATAVPQVNGQLATLYNLRNTVDNLSTHPALGNILGVLDQFETTDVTPETTNARGLYNQLFSQTAISQLQAMRDASKTGGAVGQVTEAEWDKLSNTAFAMNPKQSPEDFKIGLANYKNTLNQIEDKLRGTYKSTYGGKIDFTPPKYTTYAQAHKSNALKTGGVGNSNKPAKIPTPQTIEEYNALPPGAAYFDTEDNKTYRKP